MAWKIALEIRNDDAAMEGPWHGSLCRGLTPGLNGALEVGSHLPGGEARLEPFTQAFERSGGCAHEDPLGIARDLGNRGIDAVKYEVEYGAGSIGRHEDDPEGAHNSRTCVLFGCNFGGGKF